MSTRPEAVKRGGGPEVVHWKRVGSDFARLVGLALALGLAVGLLLTAAAVALPAPLQEDWPTRADAVTPSDATSGGFLMRHAPSEEWALAPALATDVTFHVSGVVARARVRQLFRNDTDAWVEGIYAFPLPESAAVDHLRMRIGRVLIEGQIRERAEARAEYRKARDSGRKASLLEQERPNIFTTSVANLGPGEELSVEIEFQQTLAFDAGEERLRFPLVIGPRYVPGRPTGAPPRGAGWSPDTDEVEDASRITPPVLPPTAALRNPVRIEVDLDAGFPIAELRSRYHEMEAERRGEGSYRVTLRDETVPADRDFELVWSPKPGTMPRGAVFVEEKDGASYALLTLFPPSGPAVESARLPREVVYVIDTSGSMQGTSIEQARGALLLAIDRLRPGDRFNVIEFNSITHALFRDAQPASSETLEVARRFVQALVANGGTEMAPALEAALTGSDAPGLVRQVVFLTDGAVGNEERLFEIIGQRLGDTRLFTVGIGSAPNGYFMTKAAECGHGTFTYIGDAREVQEKMGRLFAVLESPVLTGIEVHWPLGAAVESWPQRVPDLYLGEPVVVSARLEGKADLVAVSGWRGNEPWRAELPLAGGRESGGVAVLWAQRKIRSLLHSVHEGADPAEVRQGVVALGLEHHLLTRYTSLVAVDVTPKTRPEGAPLETRPVSTNLPHGWSYEGVFGELPRTATNAPLDLLVAFLALALAAAVRRWELATARGDGR
jgi:Ca-activated chloride channel homolog